MIKEDFVKIQSEESGLWLCQPIYHDYYDSGVRVCWTEYVWTSSEKEAHVFNSNVIPPFYLRDKYKLMELTNAASGAGYLSGMVNCMYSEFVPCKQKQVYVRLVW